MSSIRFSASGQRALTTTVGDPAATTAVVPSREGDHTLVTISSLQKLSFLLPVDAKIEIVKNGTGKALRVTVGHDRGGDESLSYAGLTVEGRSAGQWPHVNVEVGKHLTENLGAWEAEDVVIARAGDLIPPTEAAPAEG